tara:strand:- start:294 stop:776 length:483 start_codon:yes stop_codon:yes gene_type:complete
MQTNIFSFFQPSSNKKTIIPCNTLKISKKPPEFVMYFDGCSKNNPGPSAAGAVIFQNDVEIWSRSFFVGNKSTNNVAEYMGMIIGIQRAKELGILNIVIKGDSNLVIQQMNGHFSVKAPHLFKLYNQARNILRDFHSVQFVHVYRHLNTRADELANLGLT